MSPQKTTRRTLLALITVTATLSLPAPAAWGARGPDPLATYKGGQVTPADWLAYQGYLEWSRRLGLATFQGRPPRRANAGIPPGTDPAMVEARFALENLTLMKVLSAKGKAESLDQDPATRVELILTHGALIDQRLEAKIRADQVPTQEQIRAYYQSHLADFQEPKTWLLGEVSKFIAKNLPEEEIAALEASLGAQLEAFQAEVADWPDFLRKSRREMDPRATVYVDRLEPVSLEELPDVLAPEVAALEEGKMTPVIRTDDGLTVLFCRQIRDQRQLPLHEAAPRVRTILSDQALAKAWEAINAQLAEAMEPRYHPTRLVQGSPEGAVATYLLDGERRELSRRQVEAGLRRREQVHGGRVELDELGPEEIREIIDERLLQIVRESYGEEQGMLEGAGFRLLLEWFEKAYTAEAWIRNAAEAALVEPTKEEVDTAFRRKRGYFVRPGRLRLEAVQVRVDKGNEDRPKARMVVAAGRVNRGEMAFEEVPAYIQALGAEVRLLNLGWVSESRLQNMGSALATALISVPDGGVTVPVRVGQDLWLAKLLARDPSRYLTPYWAKHQLRKTFLSVRQEEARRRVVSGQLEALHLEVLKVPESLTPAEPTEAR